VRSEHTVFGKADFFAAIVKNLGSAKSHPKHAPMRNGSLTPGIYAENFVPGGQPVPEIFDDKWWKVLCVCVCVCVSVCHA